MRPSSAFVSRVPLTALRSVVLALPMAGAASVLADDWRRIGEGPVGAGGESSYRGRQVVSIHVPTMKRSDGVVDFWVRASIEPPLQVAAVPDPVSEVRELRQAHCGRAELRRVSGVFGHAGGATSPYPYDTHAWAWSPAVAGSLDEAALRAACDATTSRMARLMNRLVFW